MKEEGERMKKLGVSRHGDARGSRRPRRESSHLRVAPVSSDRPAGQSMGGGAALSFCNCISAVTRAVSFSRSAFFKDKSSSVHIYGL